ncbi:MAG TPA: hypothetical protein PKH79_07005 [Prolixibacteraceae bacterium]|nr:hypothetical protein [Prolixibacteraceae bacterium]HPS13917.1 hypothetical protein [Prolixibacteraceae bacterium]
MLLIILSIVGFFRLALVAIVFVLIVKWIARIFAGRPSANNQNQYSENNFREGETTIKFQNPQKKESTKDKGEYVDFEEIE